MNSAHIKLRFTAFIVVSCCFISLQAQKKMVRPHPASTLSFVKNMGQWQSPILYKADIPHGAVFMEKKGLTYSFISTASEQELHNQMHNYFSEQSAKEVIAYYHSFKMGFKNGNEKAEITEEEQQETYHNYYQGNKPEYWKSKVPLFNKLIYNNVYPGIDYEVFTSRNTIKYNFIVNAGANYHKIIMQYEGCELRLEDGKLKIKTSVNELVEAEPYAYQLIENRVVAVPCMFVLKGNEVSFQTATYDEKYTLIIDPIIVFATYSGSTKDNFGFTAAFDSKENLYSAGITGATGYPTKTGAFQDTFQLGSGRYLFNGVDNKSTGWDVTISKYNASGTVLIYATYLGGNDNEYPHSLLVDYNDNLIVMGSTFSKNFPHSKTALDTTLNDGIIINKTDIFLTKFNPSGNFTASTFVGGNKMDGVSNNGNTSNNGLYSNSGLVYNYADMFRGDLISDKDNNYYIGSITESINFPVKNEFQNTLKGAFDGVVFKIDSNLTKLFWSTYVGGTAEDGVYSIDLNRNNTIYIAGGTNSTDFPNTVDGFQKTIGGERDGFIARIDNDGKQILSATYVGTNEYDQVYFIEIDRKGNIFATGQTEGNFPITASKYSNPKSGQFVIKFDSTLFKKDFSTIFGSDRGGTKPSPNISPTAFLVDNCDLIYVCGWGSNLGIPNIHAGSTLGMPIVTTPFAPAYDTTDGNDFYLIVFEPNCTGIRYTTFLGGDSSADHVDGGTSRFDKRGIIYGAVCSSCGGFNDFPTQPPSVKFKNNISGDCSNAAFKLDFQLHTAIIADFRATPRVACIPQTVAMNSRSSAVHYYWDFDGDGVTDDTTQNPSHTYTKAGTYKIRLICEDTNTCNRFDTIFDEVTMLDNSKAEFEYKVSYCDNTVSIKNKSSNQITFLWDFGDGILDSTTENPTHIYAESGKYNLRLYVNRQFTCSDSTSSLIDFDLFKATPLLIPNVFTPNGDGHNDLFEIGGVNPKCDSLEMEIYTRWGQLVFESKTIGNWWNGKNNTTILPDGVYYYQLKVTDNKGKVTRQKGDVTIIR